MNFEKVYSRYLNPDKRCLTLEVENESENWKRDWNKNYIFSKKKFEDICYQIYSSENIDRALERSHLSFTNFALFLDSLALEGLIKIDNRGGIISEYKRKKTILPKYQNSSPHYELNHYPVDPKTNLRRVEKFKYDFDVNERKGIFIGDNDQTSVCLAANTKQENYVADISDDVLNAISKNADENNFNIKTIKADFSNPLPSELLNKFDFFSCDPIWKYESMKMFIYRGWQALKKEGGERGYISFLPSVVGNRTKELQKFIILLGFVIEEISPSFNKYSPQPYPEKRLFNNVIKKFNINYNIFSDLTPCKADLYILRLENPLEGKELEFSPRNFSKYYKQDE